MGTPSSGLLGRLFGNVWTAIVAPTIVAVLSGAVLWHLGVGGGRDDGKAAAPAPTPATPVVGPAPGSIPVVAPPAVSADPVPPRKRAPENVPSKSAASSELDDFVK